MKSQRVSTRLAGGSPTVLVEERVDVPYQIYAWKADSAVRTRAEEVQSQNRTSLQSAFARGLSCLGYERDAQGNGRFLLGHWNESWGYGP